MPGPTTPSAPTTITYRLLYNAPEAPAVGYVLGWTLAGEPSGGWRWAMSLAAHGAGAHCRPRVAKAVAVRVLAEDGIDVEAWADELPTDGHASGLVMFRALPRRLTHPTPEARISDEPTRPTHQDQLAYRPSLPDRPVDPGSSGGSRTLAGGEALAWMLGKPGR